MPCMPPQKRGRHGHILEDKALTLHVWDCDFGEAGVEALKPPGNAGATLLGCYSFVLAGSLPACHCK